MPFSTLTVSVEKFRLLSELRDSLERPDVAP